MTINSTFDVADVAITATNLDFDYVATDGGSFSMSGTAGTESEGSTA